MKKSTKTLLTGLALFGGAVALGAIGIKLLPEASAPVVKDLGQICPVAGEAGIEGHKITAVRPIYKTDLTAAALELMHKDRSVG